MAIDGLVSSMEDIFVDAETQATLVFPPPYAQVNRAIILAFLCIFPFAFVTTLGWHVMPVSYVASVVYLSIETCAAMMENPFGFDEIDIDMEKLVRRIDKHSSALVGLALGTINENFDLFPEARSTGTDARLRASSRSERQSITLTREKSTSKVQRHSSKNLLGDSQRSKVNVPKGMPPTGTMC
uniref:Bestrophin homolog n=1 Tax=Prymnesium polylepis TaxID=72548 RepID=A0A7S4I4W0_9EUKA